MKTGAYKKQIFFISISLIINSFAGESTINSINSIFFHKGELADKIVFYTEKKPELMSALNNKGKNNKKIEIIFPLTEVSGQNCKESINRFNENQKKKNNPPYRVSIVMSNEKSSPNIKITITYNPQKISCIQEHLSSIRGTPMTVFYLIYKNSSNKDDKDTSLYEELKLSRWFSIKNRKPRIVIDAGHGGSDTGTLGKQREITEKDITLCLSKQIGTILEQKGYTVFLTRKTDVHVSLDERTALTNLIAQADVFVSIHVNASNNNKAQGVETYFLQPTLSSPYYYDMHDNDDNNKQSLLAYKNDFVHAGKILAQELQNNILKSVGMIKSTIINRGIKSAVSQVLLGSEAPAALVEVGFLSNEEESLYIINKHYQESLSKGIAAGIDAYCKKTIHCF